MTLVTRLGTALLTTPLVAAVGLLPTSPAHAVPDRAGVDAGSGTTAMPDQVLRRGCHAYAYTYSLSPGTGDWIFESFLVDPDRQRVSSGVFSSDSDPNPGTATFTFCRSVTRFGTFKIRGRLTTYDGYEEASAWITPTFVRLHRWGG